MVDENKIDRWSDLGKPKPRWVQLWNFWICPCRARLKSDMLMVGEAKHDRLFLDPILTEALTLSARRDVSSAQSRAMGIVALRAAGTTVLRFAEALARCVVAACHAGDAIWVKEMAARSSAAGGPVSSSSEAGVAVPRSVLEPKWFWRPKWLWKPTWLGWLKSVWVLRSVLKPKLVRMSKPCRVLKLIPNLRPNSLGFLIWDPGGLIQQITLLLSMFAVSGTRIRLLSETGYWGNRRFSVFNEFSKQVKEETNKNPQFKKTVKELKEQVEELKGVKEDLKVRTKQTTEQLYKQVDGVWTEAEEAAKKVSANVKEKISAATEEVKGSLGIGKEQASGPSGASADHAADEKDGSKASSSEDKHQHSGSSDTAETLFGKFRSRVSSLNVSSVFHRFKEAKFVDMAKKGYDIVKDELNGSPSKKKHLGFDPSSIPQVKRSATSDIAIVPTKQSRWSKKWEAFRMKMQGNPLFKRISGMSEPVKIKGEEIMDDMKERWETTDSPIVHKIQDINEAIFQETNAAASMKEIHARDPSFSLPDFVVEVQNAVKPVLNAYMKGDIETLKKYCANEVIERCKAERQAFQSHGIFFDNKILHISEVEVRDTKLMGDSPIIIVAFQTQQVYCVRDKNGAITEGSQDTIQTVYYAWAMQPWDPEELPEGALFPIWRVREMQQFGIQSLI